VLGFAKVFFGWCVEKDMLEASPADRVSALRLIGAKVPRERVLDDAEICALWDASERLGYPLGPYLRMLLLTGQRKTEVAHARWREIDLKNKTWTIPPERFKSNAVHVVPLSDAMIELLESLPRWTSGNFLFSSTGGRTAMNGLANGKVRAGKAMGIAPWRLHDVRRTVRTRLSELRVADNVSEMVIGHAKKGLARIYDQHRYADEMRAALQAWALRLQGIVTPPPANVVPFAVKAT
jgi:integrase